MRRLVLELNVRGTRRHAGTMIPLLELFAKQLNHEALVRRVKVRNEYKRHTTVRWHVLEKALKGFDAASGCADRDNGKGSGRACRTL